MISETRENDGLSTQLHPLDKKIKTLVKTKELLEKNRNQRAGITPITVKDLPINISDELSALKEIHRERLFEDLTTILNDKIKEVEHKEKQEKEKELVMNELTETLNEKISQLEISNKKLAQEKKHSEELNLKLKETVKKLEEAQKELQIERDWLAGQVEQKSMEVLKTIDQLLKTEKIATQQK